MARLFITQDTMDRWTAEGKVRLEDDVMTLPALGRSFRLKSAIHLTTLIEGSDTHQLLGRVKTDEQLFDLGAEHYGRSVLVGEVGYDGVEGFIGVPVEAGSGVGGASGLLKLGD
jgi:hypothetical protein